MTKKVVILYERFQNPKKILNLIKNEHYTVMSLDFNSHAQLLELGIKHTVVDEKLSESEKNLINDRIFEITTSWYKHPKLEKVLTKFDINLGWLLEQELYSSFISVIGIFYLLVKIKELENPEEIFISSDLLEMAHSIFLDKKINTLDEENGKKELWNFDIYAVKYNLKSIPITIRTPRKYFFKIRTFYEKFFLPLFNLFFIKNSFSKNPILLVDFNPSLYSNFFNKLYKKSKNVILLNRRRPAIWNFSSFSQVKNSKFIPISYEQFLDGTHKKMIKNNILELSKELDDLFLLEKEFEEIFSIKEFSFWNYLKKYFPNFCKDRFNEAIYEIIGAELFLKSTKPKVLIHFFEAALQEKILVYFARKNNIPSIILQHGTPHLSFPGFTKLNPIHGTLPFYDDKKVTFWGESIRKYAIENGMKDENIVVTGSPRHDHFFNSVNSKTTFNTDIILVTLGQLDKKNFGSQITSTYQNYVDALKIICQKLKNAHDKKKIVKLHPGDMVWKSVIVEPIIHSIDPSIEIMVEGDIGQIIPNANLVITIGLTTVLMESNIFGKPTITLLPDPQELISASSSGFTKFFTINESKKFEDYFEQLLYNYNDARKKAILQGNEFVKKYLSNRGTASDSLVDLIESY